MLLLGTGELSLIIVMMELVQIIFTLTHLMMVHIYPGPTYLMMHTSWPYPLALFPPPQINHSDHMGETFVWTGPLDALRRLQSYKNMGVSPTEQNGAYFWTYIGMYSHGPILAGLLW